MSTPLKQTGDLAGAVGGRGKEEKLEEVQEKEENLRLSFLWLFLEIILVAAPEDTT